MLFRSMRRETCTDRSSFSVIRHVLGYRRECVFARVRACVRACVCVCVCVCARACTVLL